MPFFTNQLKKLTTFKTKETILKLKMKILFVCSFNQQRSPTAEKIFKDKYEVKSAGVFSEKNPVTEEMLKWADKVIVMEEEHKIAINRNFPGYEEKISVLNIEDEYYYNDPELVEMLIKKMKQLGL